MDVTKEYFDIDYINFVKGEVADNPGQGGDNPGQGGGNGGENPPGPGTEAIQTGIHMATPELTAYDVFDVNGVRLGRMRAYTMDEAVNTLKNTSDIKVQGIYLLRSVKNGAVKTVRVAR